MVLQLKVGDPVKLSPKQFFDDVCPQILTAQKDSCKQVGGTYGIQLFGDGGGAWTLDFPEARVKKGLDKDLSFYLEMTAEDFHGMMKGVLDIEAAARGGRVRFEGNPQMFGNLAAILKPKD
jgi:hypothetical protein